MEASLTSTLEVTGAVDNLLVVEVVNAVEMAAEVAIQAHDMDTGKITLLNGTARM